MTSNNQDGTNSIRKFLDSHPPAYLFVGAGVGAKAGLPDWPSLLQGLAQIARQYEPEMYQGIEKRIQQGRYPEAASLYFQADIPKAERYEALRRMLRDPDVNAGLCCLAQLPVEGIITTNYDRSLHEAVAQQQGKSPEDYFYPDPSIANAPFAQDFFIARLHGRLENIEHIVLSTESYETLTSSPNYRQALHYFFSQCNLLFIGYSFLDPAIQHVMTTVSDEVGTIQPGRHLALVPNDADQPLTQRLADLNVTTQFYDPADSHNALWAMICDAVSEDESSPSPTSSDPFATARMYFATCYARYQLQHQLETMIEVVLEGAIITELENADGELQLDNLITALIQNVPIRAKDIDNKIRGQIFRLATAGVVNIDNDQVRLLKDYTPRSVDDLDLLSSGVISRIAIEDHAASQSLDPSIIRQAVEQIVLARGWYLSAAFASHDVPEHTSVDTMLHGYSFPKGFPKKRVVRAIDSLLNNPEPRESKALARLGRVAFGLELVLKAPRNAFTQKTLIPEELLLDANVLMPALVEGHPYSASYQYALKHLYQAAAENKLSVDVSCHRIVLNEIISHKRLANSELDSVFEGTEESVSIEALYRGLENMNVYVAGFVETRRQDPSLTFESYLQKYAPYQSEGDLERYLQKNSHVRLLGDRRTGDGDEYPEILGELEAAYGNKPFWERKQADLIRHDAIQLAHLNANINSGRRCLFVTADKALRSAVSEGRYAYLANYMISHIGLINLVELVASRKDETDTDVKSSARLLWGAARTEQSEKIRRYFVNKALQEHDAALAAKMGDIVDDVTEDVVIAANHRNIELDSAEASQRKEVVRLFEEYEDEFFRKMREAIDEEERKRGEQ